MHRPQEVLRQNNMRIQEKAKLVSSCPNITHLLLIAMIFHSWIILSPNHTFGVMQPAATLRHPAQQTKSTHILTPKHQKKHNPFPIFAQRFTHLVTRNINTNLTRTFPRTQVHSRSNKKHDRTNYSWLLLQNVIVYWHGQNISSNRFYRRRAGSARLCSRNGLQDGR